MAFGISKASVVALVVESILYGILTILTSASLIILIGRRRIGQPLNKPILVVSIVMFVLATVHLAVNFRRVLTGLFGFSERNGADEYFNSLSDPLHVLSNTIYVVQTMLGDSFMIYRLYVVWSGNLLVVLPMVFCLFGNFACGIGLIVAFARAGNQPSAFFISVIGHWALSFVSLTLVINVLCTGLIALRIWWSDRQMSKLSVTRTTKLSTSIVILIESGLIYSISALCLLGTYVAGSFGVEVVEQSITQVVGVVFSIIIVRIGLGVSIQPTIQGTKSLAGSSLYASNPSRLERHIHVAPGSVEMTPVRDFRRDTDSAISHVDNNSAYFPGNTKDIK